MAATRDKYSRDTLNDITVDFNQLLHNPDFADGTTYWNGYRGTIAVSNGICTATSNQTGTLFVYQTEVFKQSVSHTYLLIARVRPHADTRIGFSNWISDFGLVNCTANEWITISAILSNYTPTSAASRYCCIIGRNFAVGDAFDVDWFNTFDLTQLYGAGQEPSTVALFRTRFNNFPYPYDTGTTKKLIYGLLPLALTEYASDNDFEAKFFCHGVRKKKDSENKVVVLGLLNPNATTNSHYNKLHADKRKGRLKLTLGGVNYTVLNDGGINTLPLVDIPVIDLCAQNMVIFHFPYQNAYWENTSNAVARIEVWHNGSKDNQRTLTLSDMPKVRATSSDIDGPCYIFDQDTMNALSPSVGDTIKIHLAVTNGEGTFDTEDTYSTVASATVTPRVELFQIYKLTSISDNPMGGDIYHCLMLPEYWATKAGPGGQQVPLENGDEGYPNLVNLFAAAVNTRVNTTVYFRGFEGNSVPADLLDSALPAGLYYGFPSSTPFVSEDPPQNNKIIEVENVGDGGRAFKWYNSTYNPPTPVVPLTFTGFTIAFSMEGAYTSVATRTNNFYECHLWPLITATANGAGSGSFLVELVLREEGNDHNEVVVWSKYISIQFTSAGTKQIQLVANSETEGEEGVPIDKVGCIDTSFTSQGGMYEYSYRFQITEIDSSSSLSGVTLPVETSDVNVNTFIED